MRRRLGVLLCAAAGMSAEQLTFQIEGDVRQGEVLRVHACGMTAAADLKVTLADKTVRLFPEGAGNALGLMPVGALTKPGHYALTVVGGKGEELHRMTVRVVDAAFEQQDVQTSRTMRRLSAKPEERELLARFAQTVSGKRFWEEPLARPTPECMNSPFGVQRLHDGKPSGNYHRGLDLRSPPGRAVRAAAGGKVLIARRLTMPGNMVGIDHGHGLLTSYGHLSRIAVKEGTMVKKGQVVGYVGSTGFSTGAHLHWSMTVNGVSVNPRSWVSDMKSCR